MSNQKPLTAGDLAQFTGTETAWRQPLWRRFYYTDGIKYLAERAGAYWLIDVVFSHQTDPKAKAEEFQVWTVKLNDTGGCSVTMTDGNTDHPIIRQEIEYTDFPLEELKMYFENHEALLLPSEH